jgi:hypothetical protein
MWDLFLDARGWFIHDKLCLLGFGHTLCCSDFRSMVVENAKTNGSA